MAELEFDLVSQFVEDAIDDVGKSSCKIHGNKGSFAFLNQYCFVVLEEEQLFNNI